MLLSSAILEFPNQSSHIGFCKACSDVSYRRKPWSWLQDVTSFLKSNTAALTEDKAVFQQSLAAFIRCNENPSTSPNFQSKVPDLPGPLLQLLEHAAAKTDQTLVLLLLKVCLSASKAAPRYK